MCERNVSRCISSLESELSQIMDYVEFEHNIDIIHCMTRVVEINKQLKVLRETEKMSAE